MKIKGEGNVSDDDRIGLTVLESLSFICFSFCAFFISQSANIIYWMTIERPLTTPLINRGK